MIHKNFKPIYLLLSATVFFAGCESSLVLEDLKPEMALENDLQKSRFNLNLLPEITDFSNLREGNFTGRYLILSKNQNLDRSLAAQIEKAGGEVVNSFPEVGVLVAVSRSSSFLDNARKLSAVESVTPDFILQYTKEPENILAENTIDLSNNQNEFSAMATPFNYGAAIFDGFQWAPGSIDAPKAWDNGNTGSGVRIAIIDGGVHATHIDIQPNLDVLSSKSTVPGFNFNQDVGTFWHGTHVAGIAAAAGVGIVGIAPKATIIGVKSLHNGSGAFEWILDGILYAAKPKSMGGAGAHIINMSLGAEFDYRNNWNDKEFREAFRELQKIYDRATRFAYQNGVTVVVSAGNGSSNFDVERELFKLPAQNQHVISISSTGPIGWRLGNTNFSHPAYYTDFGKSLVDFAAPGGTQELGLQGNLSNCTIVGTYRTLTRACYVYDLVFSCVRGSSNGSYSWAQGTSMAAPAVSGVVALMIEASGGYMQPGLVKTRLANSANDLGKPGKDEYYGFGYVNAAKAVGLE